MKRSMRELLGEIRYSDSGEVLVSGFTNDSREVRPGEAFVAIPGTEVDGHRFIPQAVQRGAAALVCETPPADPDIPVFKVQSSRRAFSQMAAAWYGFPAEKLTIIGVTGTNGKTTVTTLLRNILAAARIKSGTIGTFGYTVAGEFFATNLTTPDSKELHQYFHQMVQNEVKIAAMEVSSHALALERAADIPFTTAIFTNMGRDHLDFHQTPQAYRAEKGKLFQALPASGHAILNKDSTEFSWFADITGGTIISYSLESTSARYYYTEFTLGFQGCRGILQAPGGTLDIATQLLGRFNLSNILAATAAAQQHGISESAIRQGIAETTVPGRFDRVPAPYHSPTIFVDYAHTPDALASVLKELHYLRKQEHTDRHIVLVFGCGGNRDKQKRPEMGRIAERYADKLIITSDNPRDEDPLHIIQEINQGISRPDVILEPDRRQAIYTAVDLADPEDIILIAGKGHETYQIVKNKKYPFEDKLVAKDALKELRQP